MKVDRRSKMAPVSGYDRDAKYGTMPNEPSFARLLKQARTRL